MTTIGARRQGDSRGFWRVGWIPIVNGTEIKSVKFATKEEAIAYAKRVAKYQAGGPHLKPPPAGAPSVSVRQTRTRRPPPSKRFAQ
jgi:hypothetical protein